jgi:hypothetical protein
MIAHAGRYRTITRNAIRYGIGIVLTLMVVYLYLIFITVYQEKHYPSETDMEAIVREVRIAEPGDVVDVDAISPYERHRWVVVFDVTRVLKGSYGKSQISFMIHSPSRDMGVSKAGERVVLQWRDFCWQIEGHPPLCSRSATASGGRK